MLDLIKFEFFKLKKMPMVYVLGGILLFMIFSTQFSSFSLMLAFKNSELDISEAFSADISTLQFFDLTIFPLILVIFSSNKALEDARIGTIKNILSRGYTRTQIYFAKYFVSLIVTAIYTIICIVFTFLLSLILFGNPPELRVNHLFLALTALFILALSLNSLYFGIAYLFGNLAGSILFDFFGFILIYSIIDNMIPGSEFSISAYLPFSLSYLIEAAIENSDIGRLFVVVAISLGYLATGVLIGYAGCRQKQY